MPVALKGSSRGSFAHPCGRALDGSQDTVMAAASADVVVERLSDLCPRRRRVAFEQRLRTDQYPGEAVTALSSLLVEKGGLERVRSGRRAEPLDRDDFPAGDR